MVQVLDKLSPSRSTCDRWVECRVQDQLRLLECIPLAQQCLQSVTGDAVVEMALDAAVATSGNATVQKLLKAVEAVYPYIANNQGFIPNYGERYRQGERISTGCGESTGHQVISKRFCKKQQLQWPQRGTHLLLQSRTRVLHGDWEGTFREWYPGFRASTQQMAV